MPISTPGKSWLLFFFLKPLSSLWAQVTPVCVTAWHWPAAKGCHSSLAVTMRPEWQRPVAQYQLWPLTLRYKFPDLQMRDERILSLSKSHLPPKPQPPLSLGSEQARGMGAEVLSLTGLRTKRELGQEMAQEQDTEEVTELRSELHQSTGENTEQWGATSAILCSEQGSHGSEIQCPNKLFGSVSSPFSGKLMWEPVGLPEPEDGWVLQAG